MMDSNDGLRMTASNDGLRIMGLHFYLISRAFILFRLWHHLSLAPSLYFMCAHYFRLTSFFFGSPGLHFIWLDALLSSMLFSAEASTGLHIGRVCPFPRLYCRRRHFQAKLTFSLGSSSGLHLSFKIVVCTQQYFFAMATFL